MIQDIRLFTSQPKAAFYDTLFLHLDLSALEQQKKKIGRTGYPTSAMLCAFVVMKCEGFGYITDLADYLENNRLIAYYCGFDITKPLPSYWTYDRFLRKLDHQLVEKVMQSQVKKLYEMGVLDASFIALDSTPIMANTKQNNPKSFVKNKFDPNNQPKADPDCALGVHTASNQHNERKFEFYWGYKNHVLVDCITGLPVCELTTTADVADSTVALDILRKTNEYLSVEECTFIADKAYDVKAIYNTVHDVYHGDCVIPLNKRNTKNQSKIPCGAPICEAGLAMHRDGKFSDNGRTRQKYCCPYKRTSHLHDCPCNHKCFHKGSKATGCTKYITLPNDYRLSIQRDSITFKSVYALRTECERYNSRFKATSQERLWVRSKKSAENLNTITHISLLTIATAAFVTRHPKLARSRKLSSRCA